MCRCTGFGLSRSSTQSGLAPALAARNAVATPRDKASSSYRSPKVLWNIPQERIGGRFGNLCALLLADGAVGGRPRLTGWRVPLKLQTEERYGFSAKQTIAKVRQP